MKVTAVNLNVIKNYILVADVYHSLQFLRWKANQGELEILAWDTHQNSIHTTQIYTSGFMITTEKLSSSEKKQTMASIAVHLDF